jgi:murein L,D-transpeptidase YafK
MRNSIPAIALFLLAFNAQSYANDILTDYRKHGITNIEQSMDKELTKAEYWLNYLKNANTTFGYIETYSNVLTCNKDKSTLCVYVKDSNDSYSLKQEYSAFTGKIKGDKREEGDLRTPIGIYNLTKKITQVDPFYGPLAFVTSYPNTYDKYAGREGHGIWIHGLPTNQERDSYTKGCIAIENKSIECLDKNIDISKTILIINKSEIEKEVSKKKLSTILSQIYHWRYAWLYNDLVSYLSFYASDFKRFDQTNYDDFVNYKTRVFKKVEKKEIVFSDINVIPYPNAPDTYKISFKEDYKSDTFEFSGDKVLIVKLINDKIKIVTEK